MNLIIQFSPRSLAVALEKADRRATRVDPMIALRAE
jgi:hypothetical protein